MTQPLQKSSLDDDWGEEVMPGVRLLHRRPKPSLIGNQEGKDAPLDLAEVYTAIQETEGLIRRLEYSNREMQSYLKGDRRKYDDDDFANTGDGDTRSSQHSSDVGDDDCAAPHGRGETRAAEDKPEAETVDHDGDDVVEEAIKENEALIKEKQAFLSELRTLVSMHHCSRDTLSDVSATGGRKEGGPQEPQSHSGHQVMSL